MPRARDRAPARPDAHHQSASNPFRAISWAAYNDAAGVTDASLRLVRPKQTSPSAGSTAREGFMSVHRLSAGVAAAAWLAIASPAGAAVEIQWWHAMGGELGQKLEKIANDFNASQADYKVVPVFKGSYPEAMTAAIAAF